MNTIDLRESGPVAACDVAERVADEGYLLLRGLHDREDVLRARTDILRQVEAAGGGAHGNVDDPRAWLKVAPDLARTQSFLDVVRAPRLMNWFTEAFGRPAISHDKRFLRLTAPGHATPPHLDRVFFSFGTDQLLTLWTPFGDLAIEHGPLALLVDSPNAQLLRDTYATEDVDRDGGPGYAALDASELVRAAGGNWATTEFRAGDALLFGMYTVHTSLANTTSTYRISSDTRYQPVDQPVDGRWIGEHTIGHYAHTGPDPKAIAAARQRWGIPITEEH